MTNSKFLLPLIITFFFFFFSIQSPASATLIAQTCKNTPHPSLCLQYLNSDPRSSHADVTGLALIMVDAIKATTQKALNKIRQELRGGGGQKGALSSCADRYKAVLEADVPEAIEALRKGDPKFAEDGANDAAVEATSCETSFSSGKSPLTLQNNAVRDVAQVTASIVRNLL